MMHDAYHPPNAEPPPPWREGGVMVLPKHFGTGMPDRCVVCNEPSQGYRLKKTLSWHPSIVYLLFFLGLLFYVIGAVMTRKQARVELGLCPRHRSRRHAGIAVTLGGLVAAIAGLVASGIHDFTPGIVASLVALIALPVTGLLLARVVRVVCIDDHIAFVRAGPAFIESLPPAPPAWAGVTAWAVSRAGSFGSSPTGWSGGAAPQAPWGHAGWQGHAPHAAYSGHAAPAGHAPYGAHAPYGGYAPYGPVPSGGWRRSFAYAPPPMMPPPPSASDTSHPHPLPPSPHGWEVEVTPAEAWRIPGFCAGCAGRVQSLRRVLGKGKAGLAPWVDVGFCAACAERQGSRWKTPVTVVGLASGAGITSAIVSALLEPLPPAVLVALPVLGALLVGWGARAFLEHAVTRWHGLVAFRPRILGGEPPRALLWCAEGRFAASLAQDNAFAIHPARRRPGSPIAAALVAAALSSLLAGTVAFLVQWPKVIVDNAASQPVAMWVDGQRFATIPPNLDGDTPTTVRVPRGSHVVGHGPADAKSPTTTLHVDIDGGSRHLYNPGRFACHWREVTPYGLDPARAHLNPSIPWHLHGPLPREEFATIEGVDHWFEPTPDEIDMRGRAYRTAVIRGEVCTELAQARCSETLLEDLIACEGGSSDQDAVDQCRIEAFTLCDLQTTDL